MRDTGLLWREFQPTLPEEGHHGRLHDSLHARAGAEIREAGQSCIVHLTGAWTQQNLAPLRDCFAKAALAEKDVRLEMGEVTYVDGAFVGLVVLLYGHQMQHSRQLVLVSVQPPVRRVIRYCRAEYLCFSEPLIT